MAMVPVAGGGGATERRPCRLMELYWDGERGAVQATVRRFLTARAVLPKARAEDVRTGEFVTVWEKIGEGSEEKVITDANTRNIAGLFVTHFNQSFNLSASTPLR